ncbi:hypothetical protein QMG96_05885 [Lactiplantibacillus plantarum]|uniref:hypothetical protein n=1 Tax=Lactiplantibacillus plantarum TaxID=1590 RepID=UPI0007B55EC9|nr:hypothetical protein [Lactiplantibacillus plantarum]KZU30319.1 hypothetical protein Nizo2535_1796 [Lactiplantibacillus plantarum]KZU82658.1 hypothetical protein Nizo2891_0038 [Lactiplantibacillus plantarum]QLK66734.1 hypothetical protein LACP0422_15255 [Lactiplantibacillus plantarum]WKE63357.1 hypothetical protein QMG96_05885 [Lactiplantibacillus plantarum]WOD60540.1 hypothetical protein NXS20_05850 [Lactiplantibacillus plantarum]
MKLRAAVKEAMSEGLAIRRYFMSDIYLVPSNTNARFMVMNKGKLISGNRNPSLDDILAKDWHITEYKKEP